MLNRDDRPSLWKTWLSRQLALVLLVVLGLWGCSQPDLSIESGTRPRRTAEAIAPPVELTEVSPPEAIAQLKIALDRYRPQVRIKQPRPDEVLRTSQVNIQLDVQDLPIFKNKTLGLGPYIQLILDDRPLDPIHNLDQPIILNDLSAGTHTLRAFAVRPWHESFKNEGAYAQTSFHLYTKTGSHQPDPNRPLLTYNQPRGIYNAEPILLDFYLTNAPLHLVAQEFDADEIPDWRVRATINGYSFVSDRWQPFYLKGFQPGTNWVKLEFIDESGEPLQNTFNTTAALITYDPDGNNPLSQLVKGQLNSQEAESIIDPTIVLTPETKPDTNPPSLEPEPEIQPEPVLTPEDTLPEIVEPEATPDILIPDEPEETTPSPAAKNATEADVSGDESVPTPVNGPADTSDQSAPENISPTSASQEADNNSDPANNEAIDEAETETPSETPSEAEAATPAVQPED
ncbi:MAG: hypothetical protein R6U67_15565 [Sodalinema sp.]|uniref:hypothetical protein n=1 Tax=Sodalinema sp. TaxID=3080550 RepID=UPI0011F78BBB|nr:MAG: hypothetical protein EYR95_06135 [Phormidium sp. SL48-SHIP]